jgi:DNA invertase Pin-like site-specific DNA recombinase
MNDCYVAYLRVSTVRQGESGLGLEAQRKAVADYVNGGDATLLAEFQEVESGKHGDRPALAKAIAHCRMTGARLLIAKLDRLSRDAHFLLGLEKQGVDFVACDMPHANKLTVSIMACVAQEEREAISKRTKLALESIKARISAEGFYLARSGRTLTRLGNPNPPKVQLGSALGVAAFQAKADDFAARIAPTARALMASEGSLNRTAARLNQMRVTTARGGVWTAKAVSRILERTAVAS